MRISKQIAWLIEQIKKGMSVSQIKNKLEYLKALATMRENITSSHVFDYLKDHQMDTREQLFEKLDCCRLALIGYENEIKYLKNEIERLQE